MLIKGNVIDALLVGGVDYMIHCCNCQSSMGSGIAKEVRERIPKAFEVYVNNPQVLGSFTEADGVINLYAQEYYGTYGPYYAENGRQLDYSALRTALAKAVEKFGKDKVYGLPYKFGSDRAGGDWETVKAIVETYVPNVRWYTIGESYESKNQRG